MLQEDRNKGLLKSLFWAIPFWAIVMAANIDLSDQEAYYWTWAKNLHWFHYEHPPFLAWLSAFLSNLFGDSPWVVRAPALIFRTGALALFMVWASDRWSTSVAKRGMWILLGSFLSIAGAIVALPDTYFSFFAVWVMIEADRRNSLRCGLALGLALLCQWSALCLVPGVIVAFATRRRGGPRWLGLIGALVIAGVWQAPSMLTHAEPIPAVPLPPETFELVRNHLLTLLASPFLLGGLTFVGAILIAVSIIIRRGISAPILGYNRSESVRVPLLWWIAPMVLFNIYSAVQGEFKFYWMTFILFPMAGGLASILNFKSREEERRFEFKMLALILISTTLVSVVLLDKVSMHFR